MSESETYLLALAEGPLPDASPRTAKLFQALHANLIDECAGIEVIWEPDFMPIMDTPVVLTESGKLTIPLSQTAAFRAYRAGRADGTFLGDEVRERGGRSAILNAVNQALHNGSQLENLSPAVITPLSFLDLTGATTKPPSMLRTLLNRLLGRT